jgi:phosphoribosylglycinamide formyltransferase-1
MSLPEVRPVVNVAILGSGSGTTAERIMDAAGSSLRAEVCLVISNKSQSGVLERARERGVPTLHLSGMTHPDPAELDTAMTKALESAGADLLVLAGFLKKVGPQTLERWEGRIVNTHPALLPAYGGIEMYGDRVHEAVLADGAAQTGVSIHSVTADYDEGPVLAQVVVPVEPNDDVASLRMRVQAAEKDLLVQWLTEYCGAIGPGSVA